MIKVRKVLRTEEDVDDISERFDFEGTIEQLKEAIKPALERPTRYRFYYLAEGETNWVQLTK